tara:strand:+ start:4264 stop:5448 length:1185 start_codon:yes stop_codon:yes gene_type:complete
MEVYDIIHGYINIDPLAKRIIETEEFQRLREIKQLGCCNQVFPSAIHTRFEHSLGVYHLAKKYIQILNKDGQFTDEDIKCITVGALIHDIGHGPYSHLFDEIVSNDHEYRSIELLKHMNKKYGLDFNSGELKKIEDIINPPQSLAEKNDKKYIYQIVSNKTGIDIDRFDYIMRDIKMTGLNYGIEYERIMNNTFIKDGKLIYSEKVKTSIEEFFRIRFIMHKEVYNHRTVRSIEYMMKEFITQIGDAIDLSQIIDENQWDKFIQLTDSIINIFPHRWLLRTDLENEWGGGGRWANIQMIIKNIKIRNIYKCIGELITNYEPEIKEQSNDNVIIDIVKLSYYGKEECPYIKERNAIDTTPKKIIDDEYVTSIYYKEDKYKSEACTLFTNIQERLI